MYIPVMHARQSERLAVASVVGKLLPAGNVLPFYIPVTDNKKGSGSGLSAVELLIKRFSADKLPYILLTTPYTAKMPYGQPHILKLIGSLDKNGMCIAGVAVSANKPISSLRSEIKALNGRKFAVLHVSPSQDLEKLKALLTEYAKDIVWHVFYEGVCDQTYCDNWKAPPLRAQSSTMGSSVRPITRPTLHTRTTSSPTSASSTPRTVSRPTAITPSAGSSSLRVVDCPMPSPFT